MLIEKKNFLKKNELNIRRCIGEAVPTNVIRNIAHNINTMLDFEDYVNNELKNKPSDNFYINAYDVETGQENIKQTGTFYTPQSVVFDTLRKINSSA